MCKDYKQKIYLIRPYDKKIGRSTFADSPENRNQICSLWSQTENMFHFYFTY